MTSEEIEATAMQLTNLAVQSLRVENLDAFIESTAGSSPVVDASEHRELALAVAELQRVAHRQLGGE